MYAMVYARTDMAFGGGVLSCYSWIPAFYIGMMSKEFLGILSELSTTRVLVERICGYKITRHRVGQRPR